MTIRIKFTNNSETIYSNIKTFLLDDDNHLIIDHNKLELNIVKTFRVTAQSRNSIVTLWHSKAWLGNGMAETGIVMSWYCSVESSKVLTCIAKEE